MLLRGGYMKRNWKALIICIAIPLAVGGLSALFTMDSMRTFSQLNQPPLSPPSWLFPVVWTILYTLMGVASFLVYTSPAPKAEKNAALRVYGAQLIVNFFWSIIFFSWELYLFAFVWLLLLWVLIFATILYFYPIRPLAAYLLIPYLLWVTFAGYLNYGIYLLN